jgi:hypothetical protein
LGLDVVAWKPFDDGLISHAQIYGQCVIRQELWTT